MSGVKFSIRVDITGCHTLHAGAGDVNMITFTGRCDCGFFHGDILPGGVDTQMYPVGQPGTLSARYMLQGVDDAGTPTRIFIENSAVQGEPFTTPRFLTDNPRLRFLETAHIRGRIEGREGGVNILFEEE